MVFLYKLYRHSHRHLINIHDVSGHSRLAIHAFYGATQCCALYYLATAFLSVRPSVTRRYCVKTNERMMMPFSPSGSTMHLVFWRYSLKMINIFARGYFQKGGERSSLTPGIGICMGVTYTHWSLDYLLLDRGVIYNVNKRSQVTRCVNNRMFSDVLLSMKFNLPVI